MDIGLALFFGFLIMATVFLYNATKDRWNWKKIIKITILIPITLIVVLLIVSAINDYFSSPSVPFVDIPTKQTGLGGIWLGDSKEAVLFKKGPARRAYVAGECYAAFRKAEVFHGLPYQLLEALSTVLLEYDSNTQYKEISPWTLNIDGVYHDFKTKDKAIEAFKKHQNTNIPIGVGCMQLNLSDHIKKFPSIESAFDPINNVMHASKSLIDLKKSHDNWAKPIAIYGKNFLIPKSKFEAGIFKKRVLDAWLVWRESNDIQGMHYVGDILSYDDIDVWLKNNKSMIILKKCSENDYSTKLNSVACKSSYDQIESKLGKATFVKCSKDSLTRIYSFPQYQSAYAVNKDGVFQLIVYDSAFEEEFALGFIECKM
jgi:hypothetical protein